MKYLDCGTARIVVQIDKDIIVKIPFDKSGLDQNIEEYQIYSANKDLQVYGECWLDKNNWLYMEYLEDCSLEYYNHITDQVCCEIYDFSPEQTIQFTCNGKCKECKHNIFKPLDLQDIKKIEAYKTKDRVQIGRDKNGIIKFYDYASIRPDFNGFLFDGAYVNLLYQYLDEGNYSIFLQDWLRTQDLPPQERKK